MSALFTRLKQETAAAHEALEQALDLMRASMQREDYIALLEAFQRFVGPWENALQAALPPELQAFAQARMKITLLDDDLRFLTGQTSQPADQRVPAATDVTANVTATLPARHLPPMHNTAQALGAMYVMEGSTLGGRIIGPAMAQRFGLSERRGYAWFDPYEAHTGRMWNAFKETVDATLEPAEYDTAVESAKACFAALYAWLPHSHADASSVSAMATPPVTQAGQASC